MLHINKGDNLNVSLTETEANLQCYGLYQQGYVVAPR